MSDTVPVDIKSMSVSELEELIKGFGQPSYRAGQIFKWLHSGAYSFDEMSDLPKALRARLAEETFITSPETLRKLVSAEDGTVKTLRSFDGCAVESVLMKYHHGASLCISTQAGCRMGCAFCASTLGGLERNLRPSEMIDQILMMERDTGEKVSSLVLMGTGEPLDNFDNVMKFLSLVSDPRGIGMSHRHISLSTCGLADRIVELADLKLQITLSVSLHAPSDEIRNTIMPVNRAFPLSKLIPACRYYFEKTGRRISYEYAMIADVNDSDECAKALADLLPGGSHVNLIRLNSVEESSLRGSSRNRVYAFQKLLCDLGVNATIRRKLGPDIQASCGQLRSKVLRGVQRKS